MKALMTDMVEIKEAQDETKAGQVDLKMEIKASHDKIEA